MVSLEARVPLPVQRRFTNEGREEIKQNAATGPIPRRGTFFREDAISP